MHMIDLLMRNPPIVLQHIVVLCSCCFDELLHYWQDLRELVVWNIEQFLAMVFGDDQLCAKQPISHPFLPTIYPWYLALETYCVASRKRVDIQERKNLVRLEEFERRDISCLFVGFAQYFWVESTEGTFDDLAEYTGSV